MPHRSKLRPYNLLAVLRRLCILPSVLQSATFLPRYPKNCQASTFLQHSRIPLRPAIRTHLLRHRASMKSPANLLSGPDSLPSHHIAGHIMRSTLSPERCAEIIMVCKVPAYHQCRSSEPGIERFWGLARRLLFSDSTALPCRNCQNLPPSSRCSGWCCRLLPFLCYIEPGLMSTLYFFASVPPFLSSALTPPIASQESTPEKLSGQTCLTSFFTNTRLS